MERVPLPGIAEALRDLSVFARDAGESVLGVVAFAVLPEPGIFRLLAESTSRLHGEILEKLEIQLRPNDQIYAIEPWQWLVILPGLRSAAALPLAMLKVQRAFENSSMVVDGFRLAIGTACGSALYPEDGEDANHLVQSARIACFQAGREGRGALPYERSMDHLDAAILSMEAELEDAFSGESSLHLAFQPKINAQTMSCDGAEALLRWTRKSGEQVPPMTLLVAIERLGLRMRFNRWLFQAACRSVRSLAESGIDIQVSINLCANDLLDPEVPDLLAQAMEVWSLPAHSLQVEITETTMVQETDGVRTVLQELREMGVSLSIDDFGTGYSGMSYLRTLPVQEIKIDRSFVLNIADSDRDREIVGSIIGLARRLNLRVVAEGVETELSASTLVELGCDDQQGYLYSAALPMEAFVRWYKARWPD